MWDYGTQGHLLLFSRSTDRIFLASALSSSHTICQNRETTCSDDRTSALQTNWYHLMPDNLLRHHSSKASSLHPSTLVTAQHSEPYSKIASTTCYTISDWPKLRFATSKSACPYYPWPYTQEHCTKEYLGFSESHYYRTSQLRSTVFILLSM